MCAISAEAQDGYRTMWNSIPPEISSTLLAISGGVASYLHKWLSGDKFAIAQLLGEAFIGAFVGKIAWYLALTKYSVDNPIVPAIVGIASVYGYKAIEPMWSKLVGLEASKKK